MIIFLSLFVHLSQQLLFNTFLLKKKFNEINLFIAVVFPEFFKGKTNKNINRNRMIFILFIKY